MNEKLKDDALFAGHRERLRKRYNDEGLENFDDVNVLELLLFYAIPRADTLKLSHRLISSFGSLSGVFDAPYEAILQFEGLGERTALFLKLIPDVCSRYIMEKSENSETEFSNINVVKQYFLNKFINLSDEHLFALALDRGMKLIKCITVSTGSTERTLLDKKKLVKELLNCNAFAVILGHNHPSGFAVPSETDVVITKDIFSVLENLDIKLVDHIIAAPPDVFSMAGSNKYEEIFK